MTTPEMLVDTDIFIWYLRGNPKAAQALDAISAPQLSAVTYMELVQGCRDRREVARLGKDLARRKVAALPVTEAVSHKAVALIELHALADGLRVADALIAATAIVQGLTLLTGNIRHFQNVVDLSLSPFQP